MGAGGRRLALVYAQDLDLVLVMKYFPFSQRTGSGNITCSLFQV